MGKTDSERAYNAPHFKLIEVKSRGVLCVSPGTEKGAATVDGYTEENLEW